MNKVRLSYSFVFLYILLIFITIPFARRISNVVTKNLGRDTFGYVVLVAVAVGFVWCAVVLIRKHVGKLPVRNLVWLAGITAGYVYGTVRLWKIPAETFHFLMYGLLSYLLYRALRHHINDFTIFLTVSFIVFFVGIVDEIIQWVVPGRFWNFGDVWVNFIAGVLLQVGISKGIRPAHISQPVRPESIRIVSFAAAACLVLLGLCISNTPLRVSYYADKLPGLLFLKKNHSMMSEYGYKHRDHDIGLFYSRFTKNDLRLIDKRRSVHNAEVLNTYPAAHYKHFLRDYNPFNNPFLYEMRVHIFRRDRYRTRALEAENEKNNAESLELFTVACRENRILEKYFGQTLKQSVYQWSAATQSDVEKKSDPGVFYKSPVSSDLFTRFSQKQLWGMIVCGLLFLIAGNVWMARRQADPVK